MKRRTYALLLALALSARTWCSVMVIETEHWTS